MTREEMKSEAIARMRQLHLYPETIRQFERENLISESAPPFGACFWLNEAQRERVRELEARCNILIYHVIHSFTTIGEMESYLYVSDRPKEWEDDRADLKTGTTVAYVYNCDEPLFSEFGYIGIHLTPAAGLERTW